MKTTDTREKIIEAGLRIFSSKGYVGATTREIAEAAGVAEITLFRNFSSKEKLFEQIMNRYSLLPALKELLPGLGELSYRDALLRIAETFYRIMKDRKEMIRIIHSEILRSAGPDGVFAVFLDETLKTMAACFILFQKKGDLRDFNPHYAARAFLGMFISFFLMEEVFRKKPIPLKERRRVLGEFVEIFIRGTEAG